MSPTRRTVQGRSLSWLIIGSAIAVGCASDSKVGVYREPPGVTITQPAEGETFYSYETIAFVALVETFDDTPVTELEHQWVAGTEVVCEWSLVPSDGNATCGISFSSTGKQSVTVTVKDTRLDVATASVQVWTIENMPPTIEIVAPADSSYHMPGAEIVFEALLSDAEDDTADLVITGLSTEDGLLVFASSTASSSGEWVGAIDTLANGEHTITLTVADTVGQTDSDSVRLNINGRPTAPVIDLSPNPAVSGIQLTATVLTDSIDPEGDPINYTYTWERNGTPYPTATGNVVAPGTTTRDETWRVTVTPNDPYGDGTPASADTIVINSPPSVESVSLLPAGPTTLDDIIAYPSGWNDQDGDTETYEYTWEINGTEDTASTTDEFPNSNTTKGDEVRVIIRPKDTLEYGSSVTSAPVTVLNAPPEGHTVLVTPSSPEPGQDLICTVATAASDADDDDITYSYQWAVDGALLWDPEYLTSVLDGDHTSNAETWTCFVTSNDGEEDGTTESDSEYVSDGTAPDPPIIDDPAGHRNEASVDLTGECESSCTLTFNCEDSTTSWTFPDSCTIDGRFGVTTSLIAGEITTCWAFCTDPSGNVSGPSNEVSTEVCDPGDVYEAGSYGDLSADPVDEWTSIPDDASLTIELLGNVLDDDVDDWYIISASDDLSEDLVEGLDWFRFGVEMVSGTGTYSMLVYRDTPYPDGDDECSIDPDGYTEYEWFNQDRGDAPDHGLPTPLNSCGAGSILLNDCADDSEDFYIHVFRNEGIAPSCEPYELEITNGEGW
jgi:hypothetical protein